MILQCENGEKQNAPNGLLAAQKPPASRHFLRSIFFATLHCKKSFANFPSPAGMLNSPWPGRVWQVTSRLGTGKLLTFFYSVFFKKQHFPIACKRSDLNKNTIFFLNVDLKFGTYLHFSEPILPSGGLPVAKFIVHQWGIKLTMAQGSRTGPPACVA